MDFSLRRFVEHSQIVLSSDKIEKKRSNELSKENEKVSPNKFAIEKRARRKRTNESALIGNEYKGLFPFPFLL
jgi:hypothetical protein